MVDDIASATTGAGGATELAWLLRGALRAHRAAVAQELAAAGRGRLPPLALWAIDALAARERSAGELALALGVTKQAVSQLVELLVTRGYLERLPDREDRRRVTLRLTRRGRTAATAISSACAAVEQRAQSALGTAALEKARAALAAIAGAEKA